MKSLPLASLLAAVTVMSACGRDVAEVVIATAEASPPAVPTIGSAPPSSIPIVAPVADGPIGIEECDHYVDSYRRCIAESLSEEERPVHTEVLEGQRLAWAAARGDEVLAAGLAEACDAAQTAARIAVPRCRYFRSGVH